MNPRPQRQRGFTLLEILVAFVILALVGGALLQLFQGGLQNLTKGDGYGRAALLAESTLSRLRAQPTLAVGTQQGKLQDDFRFELTLAPYEEDGEVRERLLQADLAIRWGDEGDGDEGPVYQVRTLLLQPGEPR